MRCIRGLLLVAGLALGAGAFGAAEDDMKAARDAYRVGDVRTAISILRKSADGGHAPSQALLGEILDLAEQNEEAVRYLRLAADQGLPEGVYRLAAMQASGEGTPRDMNAARQGMVKAAEAGHPQAIQTVALAYIKGGLALSEADRASPEALAWIQKAAAQDSLPAIDRLAVAYRNGELGLAADAKKAAELEERARTLRKIPPPKGGKKGGKANG